MTVEQNPQGYFNKLGVVLAQVGNREFSDGKNDPLGVGWCLIRHA
jgi:hypothetical protein